MPQGDYDKPRVRDGSTQWLAQRRVVVLQYVSYVYSNSYVSMFHSLFPNSKLLETTSFFLGLAYMYVGHHYMVRTRNLESSLNSLRALEERFAPAAATGESPLQQFFPLDGAARAYRVRSVGRSQLVCVCVVGILWYVGCELSSLHQHHIVFYRQLLVVVVARLTKCS